MIDGTALDADSFGETKNGVWIPKNASGLTYGTNGFRLTYGNASDLGEDSAGSNDWTAVNLATHDQMLDSPTFGNEGSANFPIINMLDPTITTSAISEGNLKITEGNQRGGKATFAVPLTGKWYWEAYCYADTAQEMWNGITGITTNSSGEGRGGSSNSNTYGASWSQYSGSNYYIRKYIAGTESAESGSFGTTKHTILGIAINRDDNEAKFYKDNALQFTATISATQEYFPAGGMGGGTNATTIQVWNFGQDGTFAGEKTAQGNKDGNGYGNFYYSPPTDHLALCSANLPTADAVDPAQTDDDYPQKLFSPLLYTGNGGTNNITGLGFKPDLVWIKIRNTASNGPLVDSSRGTNKILFSQITDAEVTSANLTAFGTDGFSLAGGLASYDPNFNGNTNTYASWNWRANGGTTSSNTDGTITTTLQVNSATGFSIGTYTGSGSNATVGHGLGARPDWSIFRERGTAGNWIVTFQPVMGSDDHNLYLQTHIAESDGNYFQDTAMTSSVISIGTHADINGSSNTYVMYNFINVEGFSKFGKYAANGDTDGVFVYTGFRPAYVMIKGLDVGAEWTVYDDKRDPFNEADHILQMDIHDAERTDLDEIDILSNGFKCLSNGGRTNQSGKNYVYAAFANNPFKYATAR